MADLKAGTTVAGAAIWNASNLQVIPAGNFLTYRGYKVYTSNDKPTATDLGFLPAAGGAMTGALTSNSDITSSKIVEGQQVRSTYRNAVYRNGGTPFVDLIRPDIISTDSAPATTQSLGAFRFVEGSKTTDIHGGVARGYVEGQVLADASSRLNLVNRDNAGGVTNRIILDSSNGLTHIDVGTFKVTGATTLGTTTTGALTASSATVTGTITGNGSLTLNSANAGIELGSLSTAGTPFIDFHTSGTNVDYNVRLIVNSTSFSITTPGVTLPDFNLKYTQNIRMHTSAASGLYMSRDCLILRDHYNGNVSLSASKKSDTDTVGGDIYLGFTNTNMNAITNTVRLESAMTWKGSNQLVNTSGKLVGASLDTAYLPLTGGNVSGNINMNGSNVQSLNFYNPSLDTSTTLPTVNTYIGNVTWAETTGGSTILRTRSETYVTPTNATVLQTYVRDGNNANKVITRLESDTALFNIYQGNFRVAGTSTLVGAVTVNSSLTATTSMYVSGTGNKHLWFGTGSGDGDKGLVYASDVGNLHLRSGDGGNNGSVFVLSRSLTVDGNIWANKQSHGFADQWTTVAPLHVDFGQVPGNSDYYPIVRGRGTTAGYGYTTQVELGMLRQGNAAWGAGYLIVRNSEQTGGPQANYSFDISGNFQAPNQVGAAKMAVGVGTNSFSGASIAIGDNDSGFTSGGDGIIQLWCNSGRVWHGDGGQFYVDKQIITPNNGTFNNVYISSDIRLKTNFRKIENALDKVVKLEGLIYDKKSKLDSEEYDTTEAGIIAQTLQKVLPEAVTETNGILNVSSGATIALLVNAIKELKAKVEYLENK